LGLLSPFIMYEKDGAEISQGWQYCSRPAGEADVGLFVVLSRIKIKSCALRGILPSHASLAVEKFLDAQSTTFF
jgi:hypothetical protein